jgi:hypothetical protein
VGGRVRGAHVGSRGGIRIVNPRPKPTPFRRIERWGVGLILGAIAFVLERLVMRSIKKGATKAVAAVEPPTATGSGADVSL